MNLILLTLGDMIDKAFYGFDMWFFNLFGSIQSTVLTYFAKTFTGLGEPEFIIIVAVAGLVMCFFKKTRKFGLAIVFAVAIGTLITNVAVKPSVLRLRPYVTLSGNADYMSWYNGAGALTESDYSFPSGHTTGAVEIAMALFFCFKQDKKKIAYLFPILALGTACSRIYLMVHYASDVLFGVVVGVIAATLGYVIMNAIMKKIDKKNLANK